MVDFEWAEGLSLSAANPIVTMSQAECYPDKAPTINRLLDTLRHHLRREAIHYFENIESTDTATLEEVAEHITRRVPEMDRERVVLELTHIHLPQLESNGWVEYDTRTHQIRYHGHDSAESLLTELAEMFSNQPYSAHSG
ncbi:DUF7344 domain-containing protein [Haloglomus litoreum]|uniref:DUF7344 domain-containing protein n=1 Tax=Haloglomus litoreum TaxID=3034026 RepID=UPI0023E82433|nr:hypothetical protein [Haloglomus sp. DT116]